MGVLLPCGVMPRSVDASVRVLSPCTTIANSRGKRLSPCLPPPGSLNPGECLPLMIHLASVLVNARLAGEAAARQPTCGWLCLLAETSEEVH